MTEVPIIQKPFDVTYMIGTSIIKELRQVFPSIKSITPLTLLKFLTTLPTG